MKRFVKVSPRRQRPKLCRARRIIQRTRRGMYFAFVANKLDLSSTQRRLQKLHVASQTPLFNDLPCCALAVILCLGSFLLQDMF